jgi:hypothetical protein
MSNIRTSSHIRTHRELKSYRSCMTATGKSQVLPEIGRIYLAECLLLNRVLQDACANDRGRIPSRA